MGTFELHEVYTPAEVSRLKIGRYMFQIIGLDGVPLGMFLWATDDNYTYRFKVIDPQHLELWDRQCYGEIFPL